MLSVFILLSLLSNIVVSTSSECNPISATTCSPVTALATSVSEDFKEESSQFYAYQKGDRISYTDDGLELTLKERYDNPSLKSKFYIMFGRLEAIVKSAPGTGIVSSVFLQSDDLDEIDIEWFGGDGYQVQSNYFSKGDTTTYDRGGYHAMSGDPRTDFHNYTLDWTKDSLTWYVDGVNVRVLSSDNSEGYPQTPSAVFVGLWAGGDPDNAKGTIEWAGGETDYSKAPFSMYVQKLVVSDYSTGKEYSYGDQSGDWSSIDAKDGKINGRISEADSEFFELVDGGSISSASTSSEASSSTTSSSSSSSSSAKPSSSSSSSSSAKSSSSSSTKATTSSFSSTKSSSSSQSHSKLLTSNVSEKTSSSHTSATHKDKEVKQSTSSAAAKSSSHLTSLAAEEFTGSSLSTSITDASSSASPITSSSSSSSSSEAASSSSSSNSKSASSVIESNAGNSIMYQNDISRCMRCIFMVGIFTTLLVFSL